MAQRVLARATALGALLLPSLLDGQQEGAQAGDVRIEPETQLEYVWIPPGTFPMGCVPGDGDCTTDELPRHRVTVSKGFWLGKTEVTVKAFKRFARKSRHAMPPEAKESEFRTFAGSRAGISQRFRRGPGKKDDHPVVNVTWDEAGAFCEFSGGRLPTEAEWEYAARGGGDDAIYPHGASITHNDANYGNVSDRDMWHHAAPVGSFPANDFGLHDVAGNVWEWCSDWLDEDYYRRSPEVDPTGPEFGHAKAARGGSWGFGPKYLRTSVRVRALPGERSEDIGFRCVIEQIQ